MERQKPLKGKGHMRGNDKRMTRNRHLGGRSILIYIGLALLCQTFGQAQPVLEDLPAVSNNIPGGESIGPVEEFATKFITFDEEIPEEMIRFTQSMLGPNGTLEYDSERRIAVLRDDPEKMSEALSFLENLRDTYQVSLKKEWTEKEAVSNHWAQDAKYLGKLQPGESVQIEALLLVGKEKTHKRPSAVQSTVTPSRRVVLEDLLLELDQEKREILESEGASSPKLTEIKEQMSAILTFIESETDHTMKEVERLAEKLEGFRDQLSDRLQHIDPGSTESSLIRQDIIQYNQLLERTESETSDQLASEIMRALKTSGQDHVESSSVILKTVGNMNLDLPEEAKVLGVQPDDLGLFAFSEIETLGHTALRATVFGNDSNGIAFTTVSEYSLEFRMGHSTLGVTVALIPERKMRDQTKGIQGLVTRLNKILLDTETEVELDRPIVVGSYTHPDGTNLVLIVRIRK